ncbi:MAG: DUF3793 family protein [Oscillospiraceae bacterium]|nr:DUF3793 family protein [Oscillospiraceae bacterium]
MNFEMMLAFHAGPALAGIKPSSMVSCGYEEIEQLQQRLSVMNACMNKKGIILRPIKRLQSRILVLVYRYDKLKEAVFKKENLEYLNSQGYPVNEGLENVLCYLEERLQDSCNFPHEIGIFLGYPLDDVLGFVNNQGKDCLLAGCWKVYSEPEKAQVLFNRYERCRNCLCRKIKQGESIIDVFGCAA